MDGLERLSITASKVWKKILHERPPARVLACGPHYRWLVVGTVCIGALMGQLDASIAQLVLPALEHDFHQHLSVISWVAVAYTLTLTVLLPVFGRVADLYGRKTLYMAGFVVFILGSGLCGLAPDLSFLIGFRVLQAIGAALLQTNSIAIVVTAAGERYRGRAIGLQAAAQAVGLSAGPALGGVLIDALSWRWVFWINVPLGFFGAVLAWFALPQTRGRTDHRQFDWRGALILAPTITALVFAIGQGHTRGALSPTFLCCLLIPLVLLPLFLWCERGQDDPLLDLALFRRRAFWAGNLSGLLSYAMLFGIFFLMPFIFERAYHERPLLAGLRLMAVPVGLGLFSPLSGVLYDRIGPRPLTVVGTALSLCAFIWLAFALSPTSTNLWPTTAALSLFGIGQGLFTPANNSSIMAAAPEAAVGQAGGILNVTRSFGSSLGVAAAAAVLARSLGIITGRIGDTLRAPPHALLGASLYVLAMFGIFALIAGLLSWLRPHGKQARRNSTEATIL
jgi:EmrB/QacA subfamily drug resistance transporter